MSLFAGYRGDEGGDVVGAGGPAGDEAAVHQIAHGEPLLEYEVLLQAGDGVFVQKDKLLVGRLIAVHLVTLGDEGITQAHSLLHGMTGNLEV